eukprot:TRINITY_DN8378_c0_g1_i1.p1 TRINITY_DN8378_c0_g1~~TRINITY_DN8378_c0_g1_i1.p1  ORF type:complete len:151 (+),score=35.58 TRINITY_DN8378_c0_g1_i1:1-453(+)
MSRKNLLSKEVYSRTRGKDKFNDTTEKIRSQFKEKCVKKAKEFRREMYKKGREMGLEGMELDGHVNSKLTSIKKSFLEEMWDEYAKEQGYDYLSPEQIVDVMTSLETSFLEDVKKEEQEQALREFEDLERWEQSELEYQAQMYEDDTMEV